MNSRRSALIVGCGLMGTSVGLGLRSRGVRVYLDDRSGSHLEMAVARGAGEALRAETPDIVIVAVPPEQTAQAVAEALRDWPQAVVTDVASVKGTIAEQIAGHPEAARYVGSHPMAGSERSGPLAASGRLFEGRPWAICAHQGSDPDAVALVQTLAESLDATVLHLDPAVHDAAVALVSHVPHVMSVLTAARLADADPGHLALAGPGLRDVTRIAGSDPRLWQQILRGNAGAVSGVLTRVRDDLDAVITRLEAGEDLSGVLDAGRFGTTRLPGKHGTGRDTLASVFVQVQDRSGELMRLMADTAAADVNIEDVRIDHDLGREVGVVEVDVRLDAADHLVESLTERGWTAYR